MNEQKHDATAVLSKLSGLSQDSIRDIWRQAQENQRRLDSCPGHEFEPIGDAPLNRRERCRACDGEVDVHAARWYRLGLDHGRRNLVSS